jgi:ribose transport system permease protein
MTNMGRAGRLGLDRFSGLYLWVIIIVVFAIWVPSTFLTLGTLHSIASGQATVAMLALALIVPMVAGAYDLSVGANINLAVVIVTVLQTRNGWGMWPSILAAVAAGVVIGLINGFIVVKFRVNSFIATLGTGSIIIAVQSITSGQSQPFPPTSPTWTAISQKQFVGFQAVVVYMLILAVIVWWFLEHTPAGRYLRAIGGNPEAARLSGIRVDMWTWISLTISGGVAGIAGVFYASQNGPSLTFGPALLLPAFAAVFLGSTQLRPGRFNVWGTLIAIYVLATGVQGLQLITGVQWLNDMFNGVALIAAVAFAVWGGNQTRRAAPSTELIDPDAEEAGELTDTADSTASGSLPFAQVNGIADEQKADRQHTMGTLQILLTAAQPADAGKETISPDRRGTPPRTTGEACPAAARSRCDSSGG